MRWLYCTFCLPYSHFLRGGEKGVERDWGHSLLVSIHFKRNVRNAREYGLTPSETKFIQSRLLVCRSGFNGSLRQYCSLYRAVSQIDGRKEKRMIDERKNIKTTPPAPTASTVGPCPTTIQIKVVIITNLGQRQKSA